MVETEKIEKVSLFDYHILGNYELKSKIAMAALTRQRANPKDGIPTSSHVKYYTERAEDAGFILTEATAVSKDGDMFYGGTGIYTKEQIEGWKKVTESVHKVNGRIIIQIYHGGRVCHPSVTNTDVVIGPSKITSRFKTKTDVLTAPADCIEPKELSKDEIEKIIDIFEQAAINAKEAGFDGVQLHGANGYIVDQFTRDCCNTRTDEYGGSVENRCKFTLDIIDKLVGVYGAGSVGIKVSPCGRLNDMFDSDPLKTYGYLLSQLGKRYIAFVEVMQPPDFRRVKSFYDIAGEDQIKEIFKELKPFFKYGLNSDVSYLPTFIANNDLTFEIAKELLSKNYCDMVSFGRLYISNPDLTFRLKNNFQLTPPNPETFYTAGDEGFITYEKYKIDDIENKEEK